MDEAPPEIGLLVDHDEGFVGASDAFVDVSPHHEGIAAIGCREVNRSLWKVGERSGGSQFVANRLAEGLDIVYGTNVRQIDALGDGRCRIGDEVFDLVVFCGNIKELPSVLKGVEWGTLADEVSQFEFHGTTAVFCELEVNPYSWVYQPSRRHESHRIICTGNFSTTNNVEIEIDLPFGKI